MYSTTGPMAGTHAESQNNNYFPQGTQQPQQPLYQQPQQPQQPQQSWYQQPQYQHQPLPQQQFQYQQQPQQQQWDFNFQQPQQPLYGQPNYQNGQSTGYGVQGNPYINPMYGQTAPMASQNINLQMGTNQYAAKPNIQTAQISLSSNKKDDDDFGGFQSGGSNTHSNVKRWII